jgi:serine/threonine protein kinase
MAPEVVRGETLPSTQTDLYSLAVLLFLMLVFHHPLDGRREQAIHCLNRAAMEHLYGSDPIFIFDPNDRSNEPDPDFQKNALVFWPLYPAFLRKLFVQSFTEGLKDPVNGRVRESTWRTEMSRLRDSIYYCTCGAENFYDTEALRDAGGNPGYCWNCGRQLQLPPRIRIGKTVVMLNHDSKLYAHHLDDAKAVQFDTPVGEVTRHPTDATRWGLKNLGDESWSATLSDGSVRQIDPAKNLTIAPGTRIHFGATEGDFRI